MAYHEIEQSLVELRENINSSKRDPVVWEEPIQFDPSSIADRHELNRRFRRGDITNTVNRFETIAHDIFELKCPSEVKDEKAREAFVNDVLGDQESISSDFFIPWKKELWRFPTNPLHLDLRTARYNPIVRPEEQKQIYFGKTSLVAGLSVGSSVEETLVMAGICENHIIADFDVLSLTNAGRSTGRMDRIGGKKVDNTACDTSQVDPYVRQTLLREGISAGTLLGLGTMGLRPDIIFDEVDNFQAKAQLRAFAKEHHIPLVMMTDLGDKSVAEVENYAIDSIEPFNGAIDSNLFDKMYHNNLSPKEHKSVLMKIVGLRNLTPRIIQSSSMIGKETVSFPQEGAVARVGGGAASLIAREILLGRHIRSGRYTIDIPDILGMKRPDPIFDEIKMVTKALRDTRTASRKLTT